MTHARWGLMVERSESFGDNSGFCSLCERCVAENNSSPTICNHRDSTPFLRERIFFRGNIICPKGTTHVDCIYKYSSNRIVGVEIKDQPVANIDKQLTNQIENLWTSSNSKKLKLQCCVLQISSRLNSGKEKYNILSTLEHLFNATGFKLRDEKGACYLCNRKKKIKIKFYVVKCKDLDEEKFRNFL